MYYIDTSALLPYYREESASSVVELFFRALSDSPAVSWLTLVELDSALARWVRMGEQTEEDADRIHQSYSQHLSKGLYRVLALDVAHYQLSSLWLVQRRTALRSLDALHLAVAAHNNATLVTCDRALFGAATKLKIKCRFLGEEPG